MKSLYNSLKPEYREALQANKDKYPTSINSIERALKYNELWSRLTVQEVRDFVCFSDKKMFEISYQDWAFGDRYLQDEK